MVMRRIRLTLQIGLRDGLAHTILGSRDSSLLSPSQCSMTGPVAGRAPSSRLSTQSLQDMVEILYSSP